MDDGSPLRGRNVSDCGSCCLPEGIICFGSHAAVRRVSQLFRFIPLSGKESVIIGSLRSSVVGRFGSLAAIARLMIGLILF